MAQLIATNGPHDGRRNSIIIQDESAFSDNFNKINDLINEISRGKCIAFIGAGLSADAGYPIMNGLIKQIKEFAEQALGRRINLESNGEPDQIEELKNLLGEERYKEVILRIFTSGKAKYLPYHNEIIKIPFVTWITTNFDYCLENAASAALIQITVQHFLELDPKQLKNNNIFHIHGLIDPNNPEEHIGTLVLAKSDYEYAYHSDTNLPRFLSHIFEYYSIVFIGYSLSDFDLVNVLQTIKMEINERSRYEIQHGIGIRKQQKNYVILANKGSANNEKIIELGLIPIYYEGDAQNHQKLQNLLEFIKTRTTNIEYPEPRINREMFED